MKKGNIFLILGAAALGVGALYLLKKRNNRKIAEAIEAGRAEAEAEAEAEAAKEENVIESNLNLMDKAANIQEKWAELTTWAKHPTEFFNENYENGSYEQKLHDYNSWKWFLQNWDAVTVDETGQFLPAQAAVADPGFKDFNNWLAGLTLEELKIVKGIAENEMKQFGWWYGDWNHGKMDYEDKIWAIWEVPQDLLKAKYGFWSGDINDFYSVDEGENNVDDNGHYKGKVNRAAYSKVPQFKVRISWNANKQPIYTILSQEGYWDDGWGDNYSGQAAN